MRSVTPAARRRGSAMPLATAMARHSPGWPYSRWEIEGSDSPATTVWLRRVARPPDVGFCFFGSLGSSWRSTLHTARAGGPSGLNSVYVALTFLTKASKLIRGPQPNTTKGGDGVFSTDDGTGVQHLKRVST